MLQLLDLRGRQVGAGSELDAGQAGAAAQLVQVPGQGPQLGVVAAVAAGGHRGTVDAPPPAHLLLRSTVRRRETFHPTHPSRTRRPRHGRPGRRRPRTAADSRLRIRDRARRGKRDWAGRHATAPETDADLFDEGGGGDAGPDAGDFAPVGRQQTVDGAQEVVVAFLTSVLAGDGTTACDLLTGEEQRDVLPYGCPRLFSEFGATLDVAERQAAAAPQLDVRPAPAQTGPLPETVYADVEADGASEEIDRFTLRWTVDRWLIDDVA